MTEITGLLIVLACVAAFYLLGLPAMYYNMERNKGTFAGSLLVVLLFGVFANMLILFSEIGRLTDNRN